MNRDVSIIIPTYNRAKFLDMVLQTYYSQKHVKEIIIIDDGSDESYEQCIKHYQTYENSINLIYKKLDINKGQAYCRNLGIKLSTGNYILMGEDDVFLENNYVEVLRRKIISSTKKNHNIFICGNIFYQVPFNLTEKDKNELKKSYQKSKAELFDYKNYFGAYHVKLTNDTEVPFGHALIMVDSIAYKNCKYYEYYLGNSFREESDGQIQLTKKGYTGYVTSETCCYHLPLNETHKKLDFAEWFKFNINFMRSNRIFWKRNYKFFKDKYGYKHSIFVPIISHNYRDIKSMIKKGRNNLFK